MKKKSKQTAKSRKENFYHGMLLGLLKYNAGWDVKSNVDSGLGYADIVLFDYDNELGIIIEVKYAENAIRHFDYIFGVNDDRKGLFSFGMSTKEKRDLKAAVAFTKTAFDAVKVAKDGGEMSEEKKAEIMENMNAIDDAQTGGLAEYTRRADAAEAKIN